SWSAYGLLARRMELSPAHSASIVAVLSMVLVVPAFLVLPGTHFSSAGWRDWLLQAAFQGLLIGAVSIYVYSKALACLGPHRRAVLPAAVPCVTTAGAVLLLHESPSTPVVAGIGLVTAGMLAALVRR